MEIDYLDIRLRRFVGDNGKRELEVVVRADNQLHAKCQIVDENDLVSFFDHIWQRGGEELKAHMLAAIENDKVKIFD